MQDMAHSICLIKLYQITMRKNFDFLFLTTLISEEDCQKTKAIKTRFYDSEVKRTLPQAYKLRFKTLAAPVRPCGVAKISKAGENLKKPNLGLRHRLSRVPKYT